MEADLKTILNGLAADSDFESDRVLQLYEDTNLETVLKILARFHETLSESLLKMEAAISNNDSESIWKAAHKISGSAELLGFVKYGNTARKISHEIRDSNHHQPYLDKINQFVSSTKKIKDLIKKSFPLMSDFLT